MTTQIKLEPDDFDNTWKEILDDYFPEFMQLFFPKAYLEVDWNRKYESLEQELRNIIPVTGSNNRYVDKLIKLYLKTGEETWVYIHIEIQSQKDENMPERMYIYHCGLVFKHKKPVMSLVVLGDNDPNWRPEKYENGLWGSEVQLKFQTIKLLDYKERLEEWKDSKNPFVFFINAHLKTIESKGNLQKRLVYKEELTKELLVQGLPVDMASNLIRFMDAMMALPLDLEMLYLDAINTYQEEMKMPFLAPFEIIAMNKGIEQGLEQGKEEGNLEEAQISLLEILEILHGEILSPLKEAIAGIQNLAFVRDLRRQALQGKPLADMERLIQERIQETVQLKTVQHVAEQAQNNRVTQ